MTDDTLRIWNALATTNPKYTKHVGQRGGFTAIDAYYKIQEATRVFGPAGEGWGWDVEWRLEGKACVALVTLWHGSRENRVPAVGCCAWLQGKDQRLDPEAPKKALTDGITKALSYLGFCHDVFMGAFDSNKYAERQAQVPPGSRQGRSEPSAAEIHGEPATGLHRDAQRTAGDPDWLDQKFTFGKHKGKTWRWFSEGDPDGQRHGYLKWLASKDPTEGDPKYHDANLERQRRAGIVMEMIEAKGGQDSEEYLKPEDSDWGTIPADFNDQDVPF
jgi:hypothetical protein